MEFRIFQADLPDLITYFLFMVLFSALFVKTIRQARKKSLFGKSDDEISIFKVYCFATMQQWNNFTS